MKQGRPSRRPRAAGKSSKPNKAGARPGGRSARVRTSVLQTTLAVLQETGLHDLTIPLVAERAGVNHTSIYRRWGTRDALVQDECVHFAETVIAVPDTGSLRSDLVAVLKQSVSLLRSKEGKAMLALTQSGQEHVVGTRRAFWRRRFDLLQPISERARSRGELSPDVNTAMLLESLIAPLYLRMLVTGEAVEDWPYVEAIDCALAAIGSRRSGLARATKR
jgi:AcrR family transcriptional regulator